MNAYLQPAMPLHDRADSYTAKESRESRHAFVVKSSRRNAIAYERHSPRTIPATSLYLVARQTLRDMFAQLQTVGDLWVREKHLILVLRAIIAGFGFTAIRALRDVEDQVDPGLYGQALFALGAINSRNSIAARQRFLQEKAALGERYVSEGARDGLEMLNDYYQHSA